MVEVSFTTNRLLRFTANLKSIQNFPAETLDRLILSRLVGKNEVKFTVFVPDPGEYGLEIYAHDPVRNEEQSFHLVWQYLITSAQGSRVVRLMPMSKISDLGARPLFSGCGLIPLNFQDPYIRTYNNEIELAFGISVKVDIIIKYFDMQNVNCSNFVFTQGLPLENKVWCANLRLIWFLNGIY